MPILRLKDIDKMSSEDHAKKLSELRAELSRLRTMVGAGGAVDNPARIKELRKTIARMLTIKTEQNLELKQKETKKEKPAEKAKKVEKKKEKKQK
jgi:large subunit ribosomal protein L29